MSHVFLDLDGTLTDPRLGIVRCIQYALQRMGTLAPDGEELRCCIGPPLAESMAILLRTDDSERIRRAIGY